jgi:hypothetical protein
MPSSLSRGLLDFIRGSVPTYQAAEVLVFLAARANESFAPDEIVAAMQPVKIAAAAVTEYLAVFAARGLVSATDGRYTFQPQTTELAQNVVDLSRAYNEQPVTLIRAIYRIADSRIQSFADAFDLRKEPS